MGHWTTKADYTAISYQGTVPRSVLLRATDRVEIIQKPRQERASEVQSDFSNMKEAGALIPTAKLVESIQKTARTYQQDFLPVNNVVAILRDTAQFTLRSWVDSVASNVKEWPDPPHVEFANCAFETAEDVKRFVEVYGFGGTMVETRQYALLKATERFAEAYVKDPGAVLGLSFLQTAMTISVERLRRDQNWLRQSWGKEAAAAREQHFLWSPDDINFVNGKPQIVISDIWDYILVLFLIDLSKGRLRVCANPRCKHLKYFVQERPDQKYCSIPCKNYVGAHNYLADDAKRDAWNAARRKAANVKAKRILGPGRSTPQKRTKNNRHQPSLAG